MSKLQNIKDSPPKSDPLAKGSPFSKVHERLSGHDKELRGLKYVQAGILIVVGVAFIVVIITLLIFFIETTNHTSDKIDALSSQGQALMGDKYQTQIDSLKAQVWRLENRAKTQVK